MQYFLDQHDETILGVLTGFDRIVFRGTLRNLSYVNGMGQFLGYHGIRYVHLDSPKISKDRAGMEYEKRDNCFTPIDDVRRAQKMLDSLNRRLFR